MMELEDLKKYWNAANSNIEVPERDILKMIKDNNTGPVAQLKKRFRKGMIIIPFIAMLALSELSSKHSFIMEVITWYMVGFSFVMFIYFASNYIMIGRLERIEGDVKAMLEKQVIILNKGYQWRLAVSRAMPLVLFILLEILMMNHPAGGFTRWAQQALIVRLAVYAVIFIAFFFFTRFATYHKYKQHIEHLESLVKQLK